MEELTNTTSSTQEAIFDFLFSEEGLNDNSEIQTIFKYIKQNFFSDNELKRIPYEIIANKVYNSSENLLDNNEFLEDRLKRLNDYVSSPKIDNDVSESDKDNMNKFEKKILSHYKLSIVQKEYIDNNISRLNQNLENANLSLDKINSDLSETTEEINNIENNVMTNIVTVLGIFSALMFGLIAGFDSLSKSIILLADSDVAIGRMLMGVSIISIALLTFLYALIHWISKLAGKTISTKGVNHLKGIGKIIYKHPTYSFSLMLMTLVLLMSIVIHISSKAGIIEAIYSSLFWTIITIIGIVIIIIGLICFFLKNFHLNNHSDTPKKE